MFKKYIVISGLFLLLLICLFAVQFCKPSPKPGNSTALDNNAFTGDLACKSCHAKAYEEWKQSDHFKAMELPNDTTVLGDFNNASFSADGVQSRFFKKAGVFYINTEGPDGKNHDYPVKYTFGHYPLQQYLVAFENGKLQSTRLSWNSKDKRWFHQYAGQKIHYRDWLHWTGNAQNWNTMCADCHSTNLQKKYDVEKDAYNTTYDVINVSCESCHGPGKNHIAFVNSADYTKGMKTDYALLQLNNSKNQLQQINSCAPCHAVQNHIDATHINSNELLDNYVPVLPTTERFFADGQMREEDYNYASFLQSKMHSRGITCSNCHNPHTGKQQQPGNLTCLQCHSNNYEAASHTFHTPNTEGAQCKNCHAPGTVYMGNDLRHDHSFRVPRPDLSVKYGTPNACNKCHTNKSAQWSAAAIDKWFGPKRKYHFAEDLIPGSAINDKSEMHLTKLIGDTAVPNIIKATAYEYLGNIQTQSSLNTLMEGLKNTHAHIRQQALSSLVQFGSSITDVNAIAILLTDKVRAVRLAAAAVIESVGVNQLPQQYQSAYAAANMEREKSLLFQTDFAHGNIAIADYYRRNNRLTEAEKFYIRALLKDSLANLARLNLAGTYSAQGKNNEALKTLLLAVKTDTKNDQAWYNLALLYSEMKLPKEAIAAFEKAVQLQSSNPRLYYNYGLMLQQNADAPKAISILQKGLSYDINNESLHYAIAYVYLSGNQKEKALPHVTFLKKQNPDNPDYQPLFAAVGIQ